MSIIDETILLAFLRSTKFNIQKACEKFENCALLSYRYPQYFDVERNRDRILERNMALLDTGMLYMLDERDSEGRVVLVVKLGRRDPDIFPVSDIFKLFQCVFATLILSSEENHVSGFVFCIDHKNVGFREFGTTDLKTYFYVMKNCIALRLKKCVVLNVNRFTSTLVDLAKSVMSKKMKERLAVFKDSTELIKHVKPKSIIPPVYGGDGLCEEILIGKFKKMMYEYHEEIQDIWNIDVDESKITKTKYRPVVEPEVIGSFRTLEID